VADCVPEYQEGVRFKMSAENKELYTNLPFAVLRLFFTRYYRRIFYVFYR